MAKEKKLRKFKLLPKVGKHFEPSPNYDPNKPQDEDNMREEVYGPGETVESYQDLKEKFPGKFEEVTGRHSSKDEDEDSDPEDGGEKEDVTENFKGAEEAGLKVFKEDNTFYVHEAGEDDPMDGAKDGFTKKADVLKFIKKQSGG